MAASIPVAIASDQSAFPINLQDGAGTALTSTLIGPDQALDVNIVAGAGGPQDTDDGSIAAGQTTILGSNLLYGFGGVTWERINSTANRVHVDSLATHIADSISDTYVAGIRGSLALARVIDFAVPPALTIGQVSAPTLSTAGRLMVDGSQVTQPISAGSLPLPAGAATEVTLDNAVDVLSSIDTKTPALGQALMAVSVPVAIASDQSTLPVDSGDIHTVDSGGDTYIAGTTEGALSIGRVVDKDAPPTLTIGQMSGLTLDVTGALLTTKANPSAVESAIAASQNDQAFSAFVSSFNLGTAGTETPVMLIRNPSPGSTLTVYMNTLSVNNEVKTQTAKVRIYKAPTVSVTGTPVTPANFKLGSVVTSVITPFSGPTITSNGTQLFIFATGANQNDLRRSFEFAIIIPPGEDLLLTGEGSNNNTLVDLEVEWAEV